MRAGQAKFSFMATLWLYRDGEMVSELKLGQGSYLVGRDKSCDLVLARKLASRKHFRVTWKPEGRYLLEDLETENGTYIDGVREYNRLLGESAIIQVGEELLLFEAHDDQGEKIVDPVAEAMVSIGKKPVRDSSKVPPDGATPTDGIGPGLLRRKQAALRVRARPHLSLPVGGREREKLFVLDFEVNPIGLGTTQISLGPSPKGKPTVLAELVRSKGRFSIRAKGLFAKILVNGKSVSKSPLKAGDKITIEDQTLIFRPGIRTKS